MKTDRISRTKIVREAYFRLVLVSIVSLATTNLCGFIDNIVISRYLGAQALAAVGFFSPISVLNGLAYVVVLGAVVLCGNFIGSGQSEKVNSLFNSSFITIFAVCSLIAMILMICRSPLSILLGARDEAGRMLEAYMLGYAPCIMLSSLSALLISLASFNNELNKTYIAAAAMFFGNMGLDVLLAEPLGIFGIGLASSLASLASLLVILPAYIRKDATIHFERAPFSISLVLQASARGLSSLLFSGGLMIKNSLINYSLTACVGAEGIAAANVLASFCGMAGTLSGGCTYAFSTLASLYYGEEDRETLIDLLHIALLTGTVVTTVLAAGMILFSAPLAGAYFETGTAGWEMARSMFVLGFLFFPINAVINTLLYGYKAQGRMTLVNIMSFVEVAAIGVFAVLTAPRFGADAVWLANTWSDILVLAIILVSVFVWRKKPSLKAHDLLKLPADFGANELEHVDYTVSAVKDVPAVSQSIIDFCNSRGTGGRKAFLAGLCVEEIACNALEHGSTHAKHHSFNVPAHDGTHLKRHYVSVRVVCKQELTIRIRDDCRKFDPRERMNMHHPESPEENIGLRMVAGISTSIDYYNNAGINTLIMKV